MARKDLELRLKAVAAMLAARGDAVKAHPIFLKYAPDHGLKEEVNAFLRRWWRRHEERDEGECFLYDSPRSGRPPHLQQHHIETAVKEFSKGYWHHGLHDGWPSVEKVRAASAGGTLSAPPYLVPSPALAPTDPPTLPSLLQACESNAKLRAIIAETEVSPDYLWRKAREFEPKLTFIKTTVKPKFTKAQMEERFAFCMDMLEKGEGLTDFLHSIVWEDESSVPLEPQPLRVIGLRGREVLVQDPRKHTDKRKIPWIHYMLSVCWATGLVKLDILSYTPGYDDPIQFYVSVPALARPRFCPHAPHLARSLPVLLAVAASV
jgi:hypothetical protein